MDITKLSLSNKKKLKNADLDTIISINVLEHIKNDSLALKNMHELLSKSGRVLLFVPALPALYGTFDEKFGHYRRYTKKELIYKLEIAGFKIEQIRYFNLIGIIWWYLYGKVFRFGNFPKSTGLFLSIVVPVLSFIEKLFPPPIGQSLIVVGRKC